MPDQPDLTKPPAEVRCSGCGELVYPEAYLIAHHAFVPMGEGRWKWRSLDFNEVVHECPDPAQAPAIADDQVLLSPLLIRYHTAEQG